ncbi:MAG: ABC transporter permease subunit, partial [Rhodobacterales bacterium]
MTAIPDPSKKGFKFSQLLYDTRYRSMTIQIIALFGILLFFGWLINNTASNLATLGKPIQFKFLGEPASYDINQRLLDYTSRDTHLRASLIGLLNTLILAFMGCITATVLGVAIGVMRLSKNWLVARVMTLYIETFRNIPVLLWIIIVFSIMIETMPTPSAFRSGEASMMLYDSIAITNRGVYVPEPLFSRSLGDWNLFGTSSLRF